MRRIFLLILALLIIPASASADLTLTPGEGIDMSSAGAGTDVTVKGEDATDANKGIAKFDSGDFTVTGGNVVNAVDTMSELQSQIADATVVDTTQIDSYSELNTVVTDATLTHNGLIDTMSELQTIVTDATVMDTTQVDSFSELQTLVLDKTLTNAEDDATISGDYTYNSTVNAGEGSLEIPNATTLPGGACTVGQLYQDTDATTGAQIYGCESGSWVVQTGGGAGFDSTAVDSATWSDGSQTSNVWTFDLTTGDTTMTMSANNVTFSSTVTMQTLIINGTGLAVLPGGLTINNEGGSANTDDLTWNSDLISSAFHGDASDDDITIKVPTLFETTVTMGSVLSGYTFPLVDGTDGQALTTTGENTLQFTTVGGAPSTADYWVGTAQGGLSAEVVITNKASLEAEISDVADFAEADGDTYSGTHDMTAATLTGGVSTWANTLRMPAASPSGTLLTTDGDMGLDMTDGTWSIQNTSDHAALSTSTDVAYASLIKTICSTILEPDLVQAVTDQVPLFAVESTRFPHGIEITRAYLKASTFGTPAYMANIELWDAPIDASPTTITTLTMADTTSATEVDEAPDSTSTVGAGSLVMWDLTTNSNMDWVESCIDFYQPNE